MARIGVDVFADVEDIKAQSFVADGPIGPFWILRVGEVSIFLSDSKVVDALLRALGEIRAGIADDGMFHGHPGGELPLDCPRCWEIAPATAEAVEAFGR
jgi:hypothetical protein